MTSRTPEPLPVAVVGAGPIGLETAIALGEVGVRAAVLEAGDIGGSMGWWPRDTPFFSSPERLEIAGVPIVTEGERKCTGEEYRRYLRQVTLARAVDVRTFTRVVGVDREAHSFTLALAPSDHAVGGPAELARRAPAAADTLRCERLVLAIGNMHRPSLLGIEGESLPRVSHYMHDPHEHAGRDVLVVGGKNSAVEAAIRLFRVGARVTMSYRREEFESRRVKFWLLPELRSLIDAGKVGFLPATTPVRIEPDGLRLRTTFDNGAEFRSDDVLLMTGYAQDASLLAAAGVTFDDSEERRPLVSRITQEAEAAPGVYVAGTACGGSQKRARFFIETCHVHARRIAAAIIGDPQDIPTPEAILPES